MADSVSSSPITLLASTSAPPAVADVDDVCSICLEAFGSHDPPTVTNCNHDYHLQCILEWSQRSKECPICWQLLVLKDPASQELLAAVENERSLRSVLNNCPIYEEPEIDHDYTDESDLEERIMWNFAANRVRHINRRRRQRPSGVSPARVIPSVSATTDVPNGQQAYASLEEFHTAGYGSTGIGSLTSGTSLNITNQAPSARNVGSETVGVTDAFPVPRVLRRQSSTDSPERPSSSEILKIPESVKSKFSAASAKYKESISKSTRGLKEKLLARNSSVKEIGRGVQREMSAGIAGVARMIERLELASKRTVPVSNCDVADLNSSKGKDVREDMTLQSHTGNSVLAARDGSSHVQPLHL